MFIPTRNCKAMLHVCYMLSIVQLRSLGFHPIAKVWWSEGREVDRSLGAQQELRCAPGRLSGVGEAYQKDGEHMGKWWTILKNDGTYGKMMVHYRNSEHEAILNHSKMEHRWLSQMKQWIWGCPMKKVHFRIGGQTMQQFWRTKARWVYNIWYTQ